MSNTLLGQEIFESGTWNSISFSDEDLQGIVDSFNAMKLAGRVPLCFGHSGPDARTDGEPALGWVSKIYRQGSKLLADFTDIPTVVYEAIGKKLYKFVSIELLKNVKANTGYIPWLLDRVAILGATAPAVGTLKELATLTMARGSGLQGEAVVVFSRADEPAPPNTDPRRSKRMAEDNSKALSELTEKFADLARQVVELQGENASLKKREAEFSQLKVRYESLQKQIDGDKVAAARKVVTDLLEAAVKAEEILPAARERFCKVYRVGDDEVVTTITAEDVKEFIKENPNPKPKKVAKREVFSLKDPNADVPEGTSPDVELTMRSKALLASRNIHTFSHEQLLGAALEIMRSNPELAQEYKHLPENKAQKAA